MYAIDWLFFFLCYEAWIPVHVLANSGQSRNNLQMIRDGIWEGMVLSILRDQCSYGADKAWFIQLLLYFVLGIFRGLRILGKGAATSTEIFFV